VSAGILALDTSALTVALAVRTAGGVVREASHGFARPHASGLVPAIRALLVSSGMNVRHLRAIGVGLGPGSFTGLRVGLTAAKTLAYATGCDLVGLDSLEAIAIGQSQPGSVVVIADAQRAEVFRARFLRSAEGGVQRLGPTQVVSVSQLVDELRPRDIVAGQALEKLRSSLHFPEDVVLASVDHCIPTGVALLALTQAALKEGSRIDPAALEPVYIRRSAAEEKALPRADRPDTDVSLP
jgi:tRNA threonylcarbamoyladenosine biosynthesis protein TsaB